MDGVVRKVNARMLDNCVSLISDDGNERNMIQLLFVDNAALVADSDEKLRQLVHEFRRLCKGKKLRLNESKNNEVYQDGG